MGGGGGGRHIGGLGGPMTHPLPPAPVPARSPGSTPPPINQE